MSSRRAVAVIIGCAAALNGCYRSAALKPAEVASLSPEGDSLYVEDAQGHPLVLRGYDTVAIEEFEDTGYEFENPVSARREPGVLVVADRYSERRFRLDDVQTIRVRVAAPERPWIVAGIAAGSMLLLGFLGSNVVSCHGLSCIGARAGGAFIGGVVGLGLGIAIGIPSTASITPESTAPR